MLERTTVPIRSNRLIRIVTHEGKKKYQKDTHLVGIVPRNLHLSRGDTPRVDREERRRAGNIADVSGVRFLLTAVAFVPGTGFLLLLFCCFELACPALVLELGEALPDSDVASKLDRSPEPDVALGKFLELQPCLPLFSQTTALMSESRHTLTCLESTLLGALGCPLWPGLFCFT